MEPNPQFPNDTGDLARQYAMTAANSQTRAAFDAEFPDTVTAFRSNAPNPLQLLVFQNDLSVLIVSVDEATKVVECFYTDAHLADGLVAKQILTNRGYTFARFTRKRAQA